MQRLARQLTGLLLHLPPGLLLRMAGGRRTVIDGRSLDPAFELVTAQQRGRPQIASLSVEEARRASNTGMRLLAGPRQAMDRIERLSLPGAAGALSARLYRPRGVATPAPLLLWFHQGGFVIGELDWSESFCTRLADTAGCLVLAASYRLAPEHRFPAAIEDALALWDWLGSHAGELGADPARLLVGGDSAGGNLAANVTQHARGGGPRPIFQLLVYPWLAGAADTHSAQSCAQCYPVGREFMDWVNRHLLESPEQLSHPLLNPLHKPELAGLPPALIASAGFDPLRDEAGLYADRLQAAGVPVIYRCYDSLCHSFLAMGAVPAAARAQQEIAEAVARALAGGAPAQAG